MSRAFRAHWGAWVAACGLWLSACGHAPAARVAKGTPECAAAPTFARASELFEAGICGSPAQFLGHPVCDEWRAFLLGTEPTLGVHAFAVGPTFRVELLSNGKLIWSEENPMYAVYNAGYTRRLEVVRLLDVFPETPQEKLEGERYPAAAFGGHRDTSSSLDHYIDDHIVNPPLLHLTQSRDGLVVERGCNGRAFTRQHGDRLYLLQSRAHENDQDYDPHPIVYFTILALPK